MELIKEHRYTCKTEAGNRNHEIASLTGNTSVVIVTYNHQEFIGPCLESVSRCDPLEIIVVDNGSSDRTCEIIENDHKNVHLIKNIGNVGYGRGNNIGVGHSKGEYILILNPDTVIEEDSIGHLIKHLNRHKEVITTPKILTYDGRKINTCGLLLHFTGLSFTRGHGESPRSFERSEQIAGLSGACFALRRSSFLELGGFDEAFFSYMEDSEFSWRANLNGFKIILVSQAVIRHDYRLSVSPDKLHNLERGRYLILKKFLSTKDIVMILPSLMMTELLTWGYSLRLGKKGLRAKIGAAFSAMNAEMKKHPNGIPELKSIEIPHVLIDGYVLEKVARRIANIIYCMNWRVLNQ